MKKELKDVPMKVSKTVYNKLKELKTIPEEPFSDVIWRLIINYKSIKQ
jgi:predicted CopG family antitoxin